MAAKITRFLAYSLFRFILPLTLLIGCLVRYSGLSLIYGILLLLTPLFKSPTIESLHGATGHFLKAVLAISSLIFLSQSLFHIVLVSIATPAEPYGSIFGNCTEKESLVRQIGFQRLDDVPAKHIARLIGPDLLVFLVAIAVLAICSKILKEGTKGSELTSVVHPQKRRVHKILQFSKITLLILLLAACSIIVPSLLSAFYFLTFLIAVTFWAFGNSLGKRFSSFKFILLVYTSLHLILLYLYQFPFFQEILEEDSLAARLTGFTALVHTNCAVPWDIDFSSNQVSWPGFVNPGLLLLLYWTAAFQCRHWVYEESTVKMKSDVKSASAYIVAKRRVHHHRRHSGSERQVVPPNASDKGLVETGENMHYSSLDALPPSNSSVPKASDIEASEESEEELHGSKASHSRSALSEKRSVIASVLIYIMNQSYVLTLIAMMAWSITFHSWLTFVFLLGACLIWMVPKSRRACLVVSPMIVIYAEVLLTIQFIYGLDLNDQELPTNIKGVKMAEIGFIKPHTPCGNLALQILYTLVFLLTLRQHMREKQLKKETTNEGYALGRLDTGSTSITPAVSETLYSPMDSEFVDGYDGSTIKHIGRYIWSLLSKYWIFICAGMMLTIAIQDRVAYRLIYLIFFLYFVILFQLSYTIWRLTMYIFWWVVIIYSMAILCIIYTYQFSQFPEYWRNSTGLSKEMLEDLGLQQYDVQGLFEKLLTPTSFLIVIIIQVHYFHQPFMNLSCLDRYLREMPKFEGIDMTAEEGLTTDVTNQTSTDTEAEPSKRPKHWRKELLLRCRSLWKRANDTWNYVSQYLWRLTEIHIYKVVGFTIMVVAAKEVSAISAVYVIILALFLLLVKCRLLLSHILQIYTALVLLAKTSFQMSVARVTDWENNCTDTWSNSTDEMDYPFNETINNNIWIGLEKVDSNYLPNYLVNYVAILLIIAFQSIVRYHQHQHYKHSEHRRPKEGIIFCNVTREDADKGIIDVLKYFANYFFYKFGLEICYITTAITISVRVDAYSILYAIFLAALLLMNRRNNARVWPVYVLILTVLLPLQYMSSLGFLLGLCTEYPWKEMLKPSLQYWLFLPSYLHPPPAIILIADFFQLLFVCLQWQVFNVEQGSQSTNYAGGDNKDILPEVEASLEIPVPDFTTTMASYLDVAKYAVFYHLFWVTMAIVFFAGTNRINIFGLGYVIIVFCFMWFGREFLLKPLRKLLWWWNFLIGYTFIVLLVKISLQLVGCVYMDGVGIAHCWAVKLFGITCLNSFPKEQHGNCEADKNGLGWDVICFAFLLLQRRVYSSHYFRHIVAELEAQRRLASRGAELINRILIREVLLQKERETEVLYTIKKKMEHLKAKQAGLKKSFHEPDEHFQAIRSGDYYLFEDETEEVPESPDQGPTTSLNIGRSERSGSEDKALGPLQLLSTAIDSGTDTALEKAREETDQPVSQHDSTPSGDKHVAIVMGTSVDKVEDEETTKPKESLCSKISNSFSLFIAILVSMANWLIKFFNRISRNYRRVAYTLTDDMRKEKLKIQAEKLTFLSLSAMEEGITTVDSKEAVTRAAEDIGVNKIAVEVDTPQETDIRKSFTKTNLQDIDNAEEENEFELAQPVFYRLLVAYYYMLISRSELVCYFLIVLNQMMSASLLSMPLPIMVFLWGMLSVPRPSKTFWVTVITYTEAIVVLKYLFQFTFFPWNDDDNSKNWKNNPFWPPRILGIEKQDYYAMYDLALLLVLFIHRTILKRYGLWKDAEDITADLAKAEGKELSPPASPQMHDERKFAAAAATAAAVPEKQEYDFDAGQESEVDVPLKKKMIVTQDPKDNSPHITTLEPEPAEETVQKKKFVSVMKPFQNFYRQMTNSAYNAVVDVYAPMFVCDFLAFLIVVFGYWAFGPVQSGEGSVTTYLEENRVPIPFLVMLVVQFMFIIIDRALFLRKCVHGKFIFQVSLVIIVHIWLFFILPAITNRMFIKNVPAMLWYFVKCIYFALSAHQIRSGYPTRILGNFLTKNYSYLNLFLFKGFLVIPFLLELRALMDWMWTDTTLALGSWLQMEDIYANIFVLKCWRHAEATYPTPRALKRKSTIKYGVGGLLLLLIIFIIWFPLVLFSFANTVYEVNPPKTCTVRISLGGYQPLFKMTVQQADIFALDESQYKLLHKFYDTTPRASSFLTSYDPQDITVITINGESTSVWGISPPSQKKLIRDLMDAKHMDMDLDVSFTRGKRSPQSPGTFSKQFQVTLTNDTASKLAQIISGGNSSQLVAIPKLFYPFMRLQNNGIVSVVHPLMKEKEEPDIYLGFRSGNISKSSGRVDWWYVSEETDLNIWKPNSKSNASRLILVTFNDRIAPATFSLITGYGIAGLYVSFILLIARFLRMGTINMHPSIMFRELPFVDRILKLTLDIYLVREMHEFRLEEDLYAKLIFLYRSPETLIKWTRRRIESKKDN
ncbi:piezo-type mechanosensitive ion channel component 1 isoform X7 [Octopus bimaculoides]|uniref:piezo-type mechanosensitive ion channel component 1 isoform X7 n=1 Tax=Octopus bimaculoides TaxID=37653 RepID=UPI0022E67194|nr:piezo-type mechanosensitive ion channel component 1 isoform X7 [Octopus bimaculoides]